MLWVGRIQRYKGPEDACLIRQKLLPKFPDLKLVIVGDGPYTAKLKKSIERLGLKDRVELTGFISGEEKIAYYQKAAVHLQSSYKEGWGLSVIEANACGCPVVSTDCPSGPAEILQNGRFGKLVPVGDDRTMAAAICWSLENSSSGEWN